MGRYLENYSLPMVWNFTHEQLQNPNKMIEYLKEQCCGYSREGQLTTLCWALATVYPNTARYGGQRLKCEYGEAWQIDYIMLPQTRQGKHHVLTMVEATTN